MVSSSAMTYHKGLDGSTKPARWSIMAIVLEQWPLSVLGTPSDTVGISSSVIKNIPFKESRKFRLLNSVTRGVIPSTSL